MTLRVTPQARRHLNGIARYIRERNPAAARRVRAEIRRTFDLLSEFPHTGHKGAATGTREIVVPHLPYVIVQTVERNGDVYVIGIYHGAQLRPGQAGL